MFCTLQPRDTVLAVPELTDATGQVGHHGAHRLILSERSMGHQLIADDWRLCVQSRHGECLADKIVDDEWAGCLYFCFRALLMPSGGDRCG